MEINIHGQTNIKYFMQIQLCDFVRTPQNFFPSLVENNY